MNRLRRWRVSLRDVFVFGIVLWVISVTVLLNVAVDVVGELEARIETLEMAVWPGDG